ncbi:MAG: (2Fe-2S)-binding protein [Deltaproteobacteria bacterium]|nr:(2Fe-2S)-binding protein [Deltaproteobacteria bacterium]
MPKVHFETDNLIVEVPRGSKIPDIVDECGATLPFGCRMGSCGTCRCIIVEGMENLNPKTNEEGELFDTLTSVGDAERLGCQLVVRGDVKIRS